MSFVFDASSIFEAILIGNVRILDNQYTVEIARYELGNVLWKKRTLVGDLSDKECTRLGNLIKRILGLMNIVSIECCELEVLRIANKYGVTFYDASYVYVARKNNATLVTEDNKLKQKIEKYVRAISLAEMRK